MTSPELFEKAALIGSVVMPFFNIPLILRMIQRRSAEDLSMVWLFGVFACILLMLPYGLQTEDVVLHAFSIINTFFFGLVVLTAVILRNLVKRNRSGK